MNHVKRLTRGAGATWNYTCSCGKFKKDGLKQAKSADALHATHLRAVKAARLAK